MAHSFSEWLTASFVCNRSKINRRVNFSRWGLGFIYLRFGVLKFFPNLSSAEGLTEATIEIMTFGYLTPRISLPACRSGNGNRLGITDRKVSTWGKLFTLFSCCRNTNSAGSLA
jgi:hypothetical protein